MPSRRQASTESATPRAASQAGAGDGPKRALYAHFAAVAKALANGHRLELLELVAQGERSVEALAVAAGLGIGNASQHLQHLRRAGLVAATRRGKQVFYRLKDVTVVSVVAALRTLAEANIADVERIVAGYFRVRDDLEAVGRAELLARLRRGKVTVLDVRPAEEFAAGHVPGAVNIPLAALRRRLRELPRGRDVVAYCRGPYCVLAYEAVALLRRSGYAARRLEDGYPEWRLAGLPTGS
jgi:rhodanese-related sulfurtransferase/predicted transcriptional regulator